MRVSDLLSANARRFPDRTAIHFENQKISFRELDRRSNQLAHALQALGLSKGDRLALFARNSPEWVEIYFGASKAGVTFVPVNFRLRGPEVQYIVEHARASALIFDVELAPEVESARASAGRSLKCLAIGDGDTAGALDYAAVRDEAAHSELVPLEIESSDVHSICYTAGTTGHPKGAVMTQANVVTGAFYTALANIGFTRDDVFLIIAPFCHRSGWPRMVQSIGVGATQVVMRAFDPEAVLSIVERHRTTVTSLVPTMVRLIENQARRRSHDLSSLRQLVVGGEACPRAVKESIFELVPDIELLTVFASTEAGLVSLLDSEEQLEREDSAGLPFSGVELRILDDGGKSLAPNEVGEVAVRSGRPGEAGVMLEYSRDPEANRAAFCEGWFRTGDAGFLDDDGYLSLTDRKKDMILSGGLNIYSKEVELALAEHPAVADAAVVGRADPTWGESVVAFVVLKAGASVTADELVVHCKEHLASYKKPREIRFVEALPKNSVGKLLKYRLRESLKEEA
jgi:long-chain acyl-CoA synthetase